MGERAQFLGLWLYKGNSEPNLEAGARKDLAVLHNAMKGIVLIAGEVVERKRKRGLEPLWTHVA